LACEDDFHRNSGQPKIQFFPRQNTEHTLFTFPAILVGLTLVAIAQQRAILKKMPQPIWTQTNREQKEVRRFKTKKRIAMNEHARRQEAKFWEMMRAAEPGKRCLK